MSLVIKLKLKKIDFILLPESFKELCATGKTFILHNLFTEILIKSSEAELSFSAGLKSPVFYLFGSN